MARKRCSACKKTKDEQEFHLNVNRRFSQCKECRNSRVRHHLRKQRYGLTQEAYEAMVEAQGGVCAICKEEEGVKPSLSVDHCHNTGVVRGLLCTSCNMALGQFQDRVEVLRAAIWYLIRTGRRRTVKRPAVASKAP